MSWVAVTITGFEFIFDDKPMPTAHGSWDAPDMRDEGEYYRCKISWPGAEILLPYGSIEKLTGRKLTFEDGPVELVHGYKVEEK